MRASDAEHFARTLGDARVTQWSARFPGKINLGQARSLVKGQQAASRSGTGYTFSVKTHAGTPVGFVSLRNVRAKVHPEADTSPDAILGYWFNPQHWGQGYATEAVKEVVRFAFKSLGLKRINASCFIQNHKSQKLLDRVGFHMEGVRKKGRVRKGRYYDEATYGIVRP